MVGFGTWAWGGDGLRVFMFGFGLVLLDLVLFLQRVHLVFRIKHKDQFSKI